MGTGGNRFYDEPMTASDFLIAVAKQLAELEMYAAPLGKVIDYGALEVTTKRVGERISVNLSSDLRATP
jgi:hypothetical protein